MDQYSDHDFTGLVMLAATFSVPFLMAQQREFFVMLTSFYLKLEKSKC